MGDAFDVIVYTDGACLGNPGPGGWGAVIAANVEDLRGAEGSQVIDGSEVRTVSGMDWYTTNNRMELTAAIEGCRSVPTPSRVLIVTDSRYVYNRFAKNDLAEYATTGAHSNTDLWKKMELITKFHEIRAIWIKSHKNNSFNELADKLAHDCAEAMKAENLRTETQMMGLRASA